VRPCPEQFLNSQSPEPHRDRTKTLLHSHPGLRRFIGKNPYTALIILGCVSLQVGVGLLVRDSPWWVILLAAFTAGACASHALWTLIHECSHNLIFSKTYLNTVASIVANLPHLLPSAVSFQRYHLKHHAFQGVYDLDADLPSYWEARLIGNSATGKALWLLFFPIFQITRPPRLKEIRTFDRWILLNFAVQIFRHGDLYLPRAENFCVSRGVVLLFCRAASPGRALDPRASLGRASAGNLQLLRPLQ
jgi:sphingolipid delta-4 desaturase